MSINIRRDVTDKYYRYKMPKLVAKIEGKGNGIKTVIVNMSDIAKSLARPPTYPTKYFGCELGSQVKCDENTDRYIVNGAHDAERLATLLDGFIDKFVLCPSCKNPETDFVFGKDDIITRDCKACGANLPVDMNHKLTTFILKTRPKKSKKDKKKKGDSGAPTPPETVPNESDEADEGDDELTRRIAAEAALLPENENDDDDDWAYDTSEKAVAERMKELSVSGAVAKLMDAVDEDEGSEDPIEAFGDYLENNVTASNEVILEKIAEFGIRSDKACTVLMQVLFDEKVLSEKQLEKRDVLFRKLIKNEKCQKAVLGGLERLVGMTHTGLLAKTPLLLKAFYDLEWVEEEVFLAWGEKASKKYVDKKISKEIREKAAPFLNWLQEAEEEDSSSDDE